MSSLTLTSLQKVAPLGTDPEYDRLRELWASRQENDSLFAAELLRVREKFLHQGHGGERRSKNQESHDATLDPQGFKAAVARELGIHPATAYRHLAFAEALLICEQVATAKEGETIDLPSGDCYTVEEGHREKARTLRASLLAQETPMNRALPAAKGMFLVQGGGTGGKAATNHAANTWAALVKGCNSISARHWRQGKLPGGHTWEDASGLWSQILRQLPDDLRVSTAKWVKDGMPRND